MAAPTVRRDHEGVGVPVYRGKFDVPQAAIQGTKDIGLAVMAAVPDANRQVT